MGSFLLNIHSQTRWLILIAAIASIIIPRLNNQTDKSAKFPALVFLVLIDLQLLMGLILFFSDSPFGIKAYDQGIQYVMKTSAVRKIAVEHLILMLSSITLVHIGYSKLKKAVDIKQIKKVSLIFFGIALVLILAGIPWAR